MKMAICLLFSFLSMSAMAYECELSVPVGSEYLLQELNKNTICNELKVAADEKLTDGSKVEKSKIQILEIYTYQLKYNFEFETTKGSYQGLGRHFWYPGDSYAVLDF